MSRPLPTDGRRVKEELEAACLQEAKDKQDLLQDRMALEQRNIELQRRVRELEEASRAARATGGMSAAASPQVPRLARAMPPA